MDPVLPYHAGESKKAEVRDMFNHIAFRYDLLNSLLSLGIHSTWRKKAVSYLKKRRPEKVLDIATGTADFALEAFRSGVREVAGIDISEEMLAIGRKKIEKKGLTKSIILSSGDAENLNFENHSFDGITAGFGVRNFENLERGLIEMHRVLKPGGLAVILEFSKPTPGFFSFIFRFYFRYVTPFIGKLFSKDARAYSYLPESVEAFPSGEEFCKILKQCGFVSVEYIPLTFGIATIYLAGKEL